MLRRVRRRLQRAAVAVRPAGGRSRTSPAATAAGPTRPRVYLHVGAAKTGTTFLQRLMFANRERLSDAGVLYPGDHFGAHVQAAFDLRGTGFDGPDPHAEGRWTEFVEQARGWNGTVVISQELFSPADPLQIDRAMADLDFAEVHVVVTARELSRQLPAAWQEDVKNRFTTGFDEFLRQVREPTKLGHRQGRMFWELQDTVDVLSRWAHGVPSERVHVVTVPPPGGPPDELWRRFSSVVGIDPGLVDPREAFQNSSLGAVETAVLRRLNAALADEVGWPLYNELVKHHLAQEVLVDRPGGRPIRLGGDDRRWAAGRSRQIVDGLRSAGYDVVGSLDDLLPPADRTPDDPGTATAEITAQAELEVAVEAMAALLLRISRLRRGVR